MTKTLQFKALAVVAALALALCLLAWIAAQPAQAAFPGQNGKIVFQSNRAGNNIHVIDPTGGTATNLTNSDGNSDPAFSPDGSKIAFVRSGARGYDIFVMNADGTGRRQLMDTSAADLQPTWSPDGTQIAFVANNNRPGGDGSMDREIWVMNADGSGQRLLTNNTSDDYYPAWSPLGNQIAYVNHTDRNIYVMDADPATNDAPVNLTPNSPTGCSPTCYQGDDVDPAWSPDGTKIAYVHGYGPPTNPYAAGGKPNIWVMNANGDNKTNISNNSDTSDTMPAWSPDGSKIAYAGAGSDNERNISVMNANGTEPHAIDSTVANDTNPDWQPVSIGIGDVRVKEKTTNARFTVSLSGASQEPVTVDFATSDGSAKTPADYAAKTGTLTFAPDETSQTVSVAVKSDRKNERNETFFVNLSNASTTVADADGKGTIIDND